MSFLSGWFGSMHGESLILIDVSAGSVAGAYAHYHPGKQPELVFTRRVPIELRDKEDHEKALLRSLEVLCASLIREGAPALLRLVGNGRAGTILVSIDAPWQETKVHTERFERKEPFLFTKRMLTSALEKTSNVSPGKTLADESIIGTFLNGYPTRDPYGKKVHRASVTILSSLIEEKISKSIAATLRSSFHTKHILSIAGSSLRYQAMRTAFPHEKDTLILDAIGPLISVVLVRRGVLAAVTELSEGVDAGKTDSWIQNVRQALTDIARHYPLPRTIFLLSQEAEEPMLEKALTASELKGLWLSENPPKIINLLGSHLTSFVRQSTATPLDISLLLMALYWQARGKERG